ncbi:DUF3307 domain-containing protein [Sphingobacterium sp. LRF_L2]|uniref:DUF3307 domain-containing protein n=1 Tax=Sphingobacterium sp. LRF_L2 TaxID=3369421 RepID=UPI003F5F9572
MSLFFLKLLLAHLLGDFVLQPKGWVDKRKEQITYLLLHISVHAILLLFLFLGELRAQWQTILFVTLSHLVIDSFKIYLERKWPFKPFQIFVTDQLLHLLVLLAVLFFEYPLSTTWIDIIISSKTLLYTIAFILTTYVSPIALRIFFSKWTTDVDFLQKPKNSLNDAGLLIGVMERLLIVLFIQLGFLSGIGFLLGAKSIFRFGDLTNTKDTKFTEYILVGTLASFILGIMIGYGLRLGLKFFV